MRTVTTSECNSFEEVRKLFERAFGEIDDINFVIAPTKEKYLKEIADIEAKAKKKADAKAIRNAEAKAKAEELTKAQAIIDKAKAIEEAAKRDEDKRVAELKEAKKIIAASKKKGFVNMKLLVFMALFVSLCVGTVYGAVPINYDNCSNPQNLVNLLRDRFSNLTAATYTFTPGTEPSSADATEGMVYYKDSSDTLQLRTSSAWVDIDVSGASSLDAGYNISAAIDVDNGAVTLTAGSDDDNVVLALVQGDTDADVEALTVTSAGDAPAIIIAQSGSGTDIEFSDGGSISKLSALIIEGGITDLTDGSAILMDTNNEIAFGDNSQEVSMGFGTGSTLTWSTDSSVATVEWGVLDSHTGLDDLTFDVAGSDNTITCAGNATGKDLTVQQTGTGDVSLILQSAGSGTDALSLISSAADISLVSADNITRTAADDITDVTTAGGYTLTIGGSTLGKYISTVADTYSMIAVDSVTIQNTEAGKDITVDSVLGSVILSAAEDATDAINIDASAGGIDIDAVGEDGDDINLTNTGGSIQLVATEAVTDGINIDATGGVDIDSALDVAIDISTAASNFDVDVAGGSVYLDGGEEDAQAIWLAATGTASGVDIDAGTVGVDVDATGPIALTSTENAADSIALTSTLGGIDIICSASGTENIDISNTGGSIYVTASEAAEGAITITTSDAAGQILIDSGDETADGIDIDAAGGIDIDAVLEGIAIDAAAAGKDIRIDSKLGLIYIEGGESDADGVKIVASGVAGGINMDAKTSGVDIDAVGGPIALDTSGASQDITLDAASGAVIIEGAETGATAVVVYASHADGGIDMDFGTGGLSVVGASGDIVMTVAGDSADVITVTNTTSTSTAAIALVASAGGLDVDVKKSAIITSTADAAAAVVIQSTLGGIDIQCDASGGEALDISNAGGAVNISSTAATDDAILISTSNAAGQILISSADTSADGFEITAAGGLVLASTVEASSWTQTATGANDDLTIAVAGAQDAHVKITSTGTTADAILLQQNTATGGGILLHANDSTALTDGASSIQLLSDLGGIGIKTSLANVNAIDIDSTAGGMIITLVDDFTLGVTSAVDAEDILITQTGATNSSITLTAAGTGGDAIGIIASTGGIDITCSAGEDGNDIDISNALGSVNITATENAASCIYLRENSASTSGTILIKADAGTSVSAGAESIALLSDLGGIGLTATGVTSTAAINLNAAAGGITMASVKDFAVTVTSADNAEDILITQVGAEDASITLTAAGFGEDAIGIIASTGGINITCSAGEDGNDIDISNTGGSVNITATEADADGIKVLATGGINIDAGITYDVAINAGQILIESEQNAASAIALVSNTGTSETIVITNTQGQGTDAINIDTSGTGGGIDIDTADGTVAITAGGGSNGDITLTAGDVISLVAADVAGIVATTGTFEHKAKYFPISAGYTSASQVIVGGGQGVKCVGLAAGVEEEGSTEGYASSDTSTDFIRFWVPLPDDFVDTGQAADLILYFDVDEQHTAALTIVVEVYAYNGVTPGTTAIVVDSLEVANDDTRQLYTLNTLSSGIGGVVVAGGEALMIEMSQDHTDDDFNIYGMKMVYRVGLQATE